MAVADGFENALLLFGRGGLPQAFQRPGDLGIPPVAGAGRIILGRHGELDSLLDVPLVLTFFMYFSHSFRLSKKMKYLSLAFIVFEIIHDFFFSVIPNSTGPPSIPDNSNDSFDLPKVRSNNSFNADTFGSFVVMKYQLSPV